MAEARRRVAEQLGDALPHILGSSNREVRQPFIEHRAARRPLLQALSRALQDPDSRSEAPEALRGLVDAIVLTPDQAGETLQIELGGNLAAMLWGDRTNEEVAGIRRPLLASIFGCGDVQPPVLAAVERRQPKAVTEPLDRRGALN